MNLLHFLLSILFVLRPQAIPFPGPGASSAVPITLSDQCVSATAQGTSTTVACATTVNVPAGATIAVFIRGGSTSIAISSIGDGGDTFTSTTACTVVGTAQWWYAKNTSANATATITVTFASTNTFRGVWAGVFTGLNTSAPLDVGTGACANGTGTTATTAAYTTANAKEVLLTGLVVGALSVPITAGSGYTLGTVWADGDGRAQYQIVSAIQTGVTASMGLSSNPWNITQMTLTQ